MRSGNPALNSRAFTPVPGWESLDAPARRSTTMSIPGTAAKAGLMLAFCAATAVWSYNAAAAGAGYAMPMMLGGVFGGLVLALIITFAPKTAPYLSIPYALCEGLFLGVLSLVVAQRIGQGAGGNAVKTALAGGIIFQAIILTFGVFAGMLILYATRILRATPLFTKVVLIGTAGVGLTYLATILLGFFGIQIPYIHGSGAIGIGFSLVVVGLAAFNLVLDFDFIEENAQRGAPKYLEWYGAFGLMVTLVWLYIEILRLLSKIQKK
ncbi:MAG: Bax inhibitor-1/YccA family protein [Phycisphaerales bacterium]|nr:Bax inhibitor-1/YccA family protein [Phycisphaerales bacterium]